MVSGTEEAPGSGRSRSRGRRAVHLLTLRGLAFVLAGAVAVAAAFVLDERDLLFVGVLALLLPALAWVFAGTRRAPVEVEHRVPQRLQAGETGVLRLRLHNPDRRPSRPLDVLQPGTRHLVEGVRRLVPPIDPGGYAEIVLPLAAERRGTYAVLPPRVRFVDPLGLSQVRRQLPAGADVLVLPTVVPLVGLPRGLSGRGSSSGDSHGTSGGYPDAGVRAYRSGDDIRTVHWRASARLEDELVVRVAGGASLGEALLVLDHRHVGFASGLAGLEVAVTLAASVGLHLLEEDVELTFADHTGAALVSGHDVADDLLVALAGAGRDNADLAPVAASGHDAVIAIVGGLTEAEAHAVVAARRRGTTAIALVVGDATGPRSTSRTAAVLEAAGWRVVPIDVADAATADGGAHLAQAWRAACSSSARAATEAARR